MPRRRHVHAWPGTATLYTAYADKREAALAACELRSNLDKVAAWSPKGDMSQAPSPGAHPWLHPAPMPNSGLNFYMFQLKMGPNSRVCSEFLRKKCTNFNTGGVGSESEGNGREWSRVEREIGSATSEHACGVQTAAGEDHRRSLLSCRQASKFQGRKQNKSKNFAHNVASARKSGQSPKFALNLCRGRTLAGAKSARLRLGKINSTHLRLDNPLLPHIHTYLLTYLLLRITSVAANLVRHRSFPSLFG